jgi:ribonuclease-3
MLDILEQRLGYHFKNLDYLKQACIHSSYVNEHREKDLNHNERLEFLGDSVLGLIVSSLLFQKLAEHKEGDLSFIKSKLVEASTCVQYVEMLGIEEFLIMGKGEVANKGKGRKTVLADFFEAVMGAIYLDGGFEVACDFYLAHFSQMVGDVMQNPEENAKAKLQDLVQKKYKQPPEYRVISEEGPGHNKVFEVAVFIEGKEIARGTGPSKKAAQLKAAEAALEGIAWS